MPPTEHRRPVYLRWSTWIAYAILFGIAIPWYWPGEEISIIAGIPLWAAVSIGASSVISCFTAWLLVKEWPTDEQLDSDDL